MAGLRGASQVVLEGAFVISSSTRVPSRSNSSGRRVGASGKPFVVAVRAQQSEEGEISAQSRRSVLGLLAASVAASALVKEAQAAASLKALLHYLAVYVRLDVALQRLIVFLCCHIMILL